MTENLKEALSYAVELAEKENKIISSSNGKEYFDINKHMTSESLDLANMRRLLNFRHSKV